MSRGHQEAVNPGGTRLDDDAVEEGALPDIIPDGYKDQATWIAEIMKQYTADFDADRHNILEAMEDLRFIYVDQWDQKTRQEREEAGRPCITVNTLPQFIGQVVGDRRINKTQIKVVPDKSASVDSAKVRSGLIKSIENFSRAETIYDQCCEDQVGCGIGGFEVTMEYSRNDVFEQDIFIRPLNNPMGVLWDRFSKDPTGRDAQHCYVEETLSRDTFEKTWPGVPIPTSFPSEMPAGTDWGAWMSDDDVKIVAYWHMTEKPATFALMQDGQVEDVTDKEDAEFMDRVYVDQRTGEPMIRDSVRTYACRYLITCFAILEGPYELAISRLPVIKVSGRIGRVGTKQYRFGLVRWARDPSLLRNYWRSVAAETLAMQPKAQWLADANSVKGREEDFRNAHLTGDPLLIFNTGKMVPTRVNPPPLQAAVLNEANMNAQDIKDVTGIHDASLGIRSNEVSGKAIMARQREGDVATVTYHDHLNLAIQEGGVVINELIPICYDTTRIVRVVGIDDAAEFIKINDPHDEESPDLAQGKYDVQVITGPSYTTQRMESADAMLEAVKVFPQIMEIAGDIMVEAQDWPGAERIAARLKKVLPAAQQEEKEKADATAQANGQPPAKAQPDPAQMMQAAQAQAQMQEIQLKLEELEANVKVAKANAEKAEADASKAQADAEAAAHKAQEAESRALIAKEEVDFNRAERAVQIHVRANPPAPAGGSNGSGGASRRDARPRPQKGNAR